MLPRIAVLDDYQGVARRFGDWDRLAGRAEVTVFTDHVVGESDLAERLEPFAAVAIMRERTPFPRRLIERLPNLRLIATTGMWNRAVDLNACVDHGIVVSGTQTSGSATAQLTWALILALVQQIATVDGDVRAGRWQTGIGEEVAGKTLGVIGLGRIGSKVAQIGRAFDMKVIAWSSNLTAERCAECGAVRVDKDELLARSDIITIHLLLSKRTRGLIGRSDFDAMKPDVYLVNTSRGPIIDETALIDALQSRRIAGAGLDVFDIEPLPANHPLLALPNTVLTPHIGYVSRESYAVYYPQLVEDIEAWLDGAPIRRILTSDVPDKTTAEPARKV